MRFAYILLSWLLLPVFVGHLLWRSLSQPGYRQRIGERFGFGFARLPAPSIWIHAVSVGEVTAAAPLLRTLRQRFPATPIVVTTMTPTGSQRARDLFGSTVTHSYVPYDAPGPVRRFFDWARPELAVVLETEIWPNLYSECGRRSVPLVLASARVSVKSLRRYRILFGLIRDTLAHGIVIGAQSAADAERFRALGANPARTHVTGNIKFDFELAPAVAARGQEFRRLHAPGRAVWIGASTHQDEEQVLIDAHREVLRQDPSALLILVPRHPERFAAVAALLERAGMATITRSSGLSCGPETQVFLGDSMGELTLLYAAADVAFVGGSLVQVGGHNLLEPAALGLPSITGPYNFNAPDIADLLMERGATTVARDAAGIAAEVLGLLADPAERRRRGQAALDALASNRGAVHRLLALVEPLAAPPAGG
ncbi:MAG: 3-deoxy-D-manno-octulosonic acid transferase [Gammaproteobacteria bacterium]|nr:MAG: 3-deoxy-D-manno-octulosonic acid transferase [Pseudomonadota bacterium]MBC6945982.1 3-deoxy-D-manno-octulosonic acid transferase [Gammaproteobacteria bacterium]MDL1881243.1 3-deoxy-D-manno-octulosonic acid transferase [Gammaproteobacteria bacterium PRO2]GIK35150.1 MAG: 3-deoxy-D-manno-octulosonic acid transferase [Gammaproteobacteria bacterium]